MEEGKFPGLGEATYMFTLGLYTYVYYITIKSLFKNSKSGFTKGCMEKAEKMGNVTLVSYADILSSMK